MACSVVIPCHNGVELTRACLDTLLRQDPPPEEILVVDNGGDDGTDRLGDVNPRVRVIRLDHNRGFAGGVNAGLRQARGDEVMILNNDTRCADDLLPQLRRVLHHSDDIGAVAPVSNHVKGEARIDVGAFGRDGDGRRELTAALQGAPLLQDVSNLAGLCLLMRRRTLVELGGFDERFGHGNYEDDDLCLRLRLRGCRLVIARRAFLHHEGHATFRSLGLDLPEQIALRLAQFRDKWRHHPAGLATLWALQGEDAACADAAEHARRSAPRWLDADWHLGRYHERHGDPARAARHLETFLDACPEHVGARLHLGLALLRAGARRRGHRTLLRLARSHVLTAEQERATLRQLGQLDYEAGAFDAAAAAFDAVAESCPDDADLHNWRGACRLARGDVDEAARCFARAIALGHGLAHSNLGICLQRRGEVDAARRSFARAVELAPHDPVARRNYEAGVAATASTVGAAS